MWGAFVGLFLLTMAKAQETANLSVAVWGIHDGLPNSSVTSIAQSPDGYLWIGTHNGLARFDGMRFVTFSPQNTPALSHPRVLRLSVDARGTLWINTYDGALVSYRRGVFTREWTSDKRRTAKIDFVPTRSSTLIFAMDSGELIRRSIEAPPGSEWDVAHAPATVRDNPVYCEDGQGMLWCLTRDLQIWQVDGAKYVPIVNAAALGSRPMRLATDQDGHLWVRTDHDVLKWNGRTFESMAPRDQATPHEMRFLYFPRSQGAWLIADGRFRKLVNGQWIDEVTTWRDQLGEAYPLSLDMHEDRDGGLWFAPLQRGLFYLAPDGHPRHLTTESGFPTNFVATWFEDREGNLWLGAERGGLIRLRKTQFQTLRTDAEPTPPTPALTVTEAPDGAMWIGTFGHGLFRSTAAGLESFGQLDDISRHYAYSVAIDQRGRTWVSTGAEDLHLLEGGQLKRAPWLVHGVKAMLVDSKDRLWLGTKDQVCMVTDDTLERFETLPGVEHPEVRALAEAPDGGIWVGLGSGALYRYDGREFKPNSVIATAAPAPICAIQPDSDGTLWIGTFGGGLLHLTESTVTRYTKAAGLPDDVVGQILDDRRGGLWIGSHEGVFRLRKDSVRQFDAGAITTLPALVFGRHDGLPSVESTTGYQPSAWRTRAGVLWFATAAGVAFIDPAKLAANPAPPDVLIEDVTVDGGRRASIATATGAVEIYPGAQHVEIQYTGLCFASPDQVRFRYRLQGLETQWNEVGRRRFAPYSHLRPGTYRFQLSACNSDGMWNESAATIVLNVQPHFWQTWWFLAGLTVVSFAAVTGAVYRVSTGRLQRRLELVERQRAIEQDRARIARDIHDDLGAGLTQISLFSELLRHSPAAEIDAHSRRISTTAQSLTRAMDEIVWAVNPKNDTLESLISYVGGFASEYLRSVQLKCRLEMPSQVPAAAISAEVRHNVFVALKEILNNILKHAGASEVRLRVKYENRRLVFTVEDDGRGFRPRDAAEPASGRIASGNGVDNLHQRMAAIDGTCRISAGPNGQGTVVELVVPITEARTPS